MLTLKNLWQSEIGFPSSPRCDDSSIPSGDVGVERLGSGGLLVQALPPSLSVPSLCIAEAAAISLRDRDVDVRGGGGGRSEELGEEEEWELVVREPTERGASVTSSLGHPPPPHSHFCTGDVGYTAGNDGYKSF